MYIGYIGIQSINLPLYNIISNYANSILMEQFKNERKLVNMKKHLKKWTNITYETFIKSLNRADFQLYSHVKLLSTCCLRENLGNINSAETHTLKLSSQNGKIIGNTRVYLNPCCYDNRQAEDV